MKHERVCVCCFSSNDKLPVLVKQQTFVPSIKTQLKSFLLLQAYDTATNYLKEADKYYYCLVFVFSVVFRVFVNSLRRSGTLIYKILYQIIIIITVLLLLLLLLLILYWDFIKYSCKIMSDESLNALSFSLHDFMF